MPYREYRFLNFTLFIRDNLPEYMAGAYQPKYALAYDYPNRGFLLKK